jgi:hypothetical protein
MLRTIGFVTRAGRHWHNTVMTAAVTENNGGGDMRTIACLALGFCMALAPAVMPAQAQNKSDTAKSGSSGTSPEGMGSTGWTGGNRGQTSPGHPDAPEAKDSTDKQPLVATGLDLRGQPRAFPSNKAPE